MTPRARHYLLVLGTGVTKTAAAAAAGVRLDSVPHWRKAYDGFARREELVMESRLAARDAARAILCQCGKSLIGRKGQEFCSRSCAQKEVKGGYWSDRDTSVLGALDGGPRSRRELIEATGIALGGLRPVLNRLRRRGMIERDGAPRGLHCRWRRAA